MQTSLKLNDGCDSISNVFYIFISSLYLYFQDRIYLRYVTCVHKRYLLFDTYIVTVHVVASELVNSIFKYRLKVLYKKRKPS